MTSPKQICRSSSTSVLMLALVLFLSGAVQKTPDVYRSPFQVAYSPEGSRLAVSDHTADMVYLIDTETGLVEKSLLLQSSVTGIAWISSEKLLVAEYATGTLAEIDVRSGKVLRRMDVGPKPIGVAVTPQSGRVLVTSYGKRDVAILDLSSGTIQKRVFTDGPAYFVRVTPDESVAIVGNLLPSDPATVAWSAAHVILIDLNTLTISRRLFLPYGSSNVREIAVSSDGRWGYVVHTRGRVKLPTSQIDRGWVNTNALSIIDLRSRSRYATVLLDTPEEGAADPWGVTLSRDGNWLWVTLAGVRQVARLDLERLHNMLAGNPLPNLIAGQTGLDAQSTLISNTIRKNPVNRYLLDGDLKTLSSTGILTRFDVPVTTPRGIDLSPDGRHLMIGGYHSGNIVRVDPHSLSESQVISLGPQPEADAVRRGEIVFHDAIRTYQHWLSCATCHPDGRSDGLNWDLLNDGIGNAKNTKSLVQSHLTPPAMAHGVRASYDIAVEAGFKYIQFSAATSEELEDVKAFIRSLKPEPSPYLVNEALSPEAQRGEALFRDPEVGCFWCHSGPLFTDSRMHDVGTRNELDTGSTFDNPSLLELWRTGPYLHNGSAASLRAVMTFCNLHNKHGKTKKLTHEELKALEAYLLSL